MMGGMDPRRMMQARKQMAGGQMIPPKPGTTNTMMGGTWGADVEAPPDEQFQPDMIPQGFTPPTSANVSMEYLAGRDTQDQPPMPPGMMPQQQGLRGARQQMAQQPMPGMPPQQNPMAGSMMGGAPKPKPVGPGFDLFDTGMGGR